MMRNFQEKNKWRHLAESKLALMLLGILILFFAWGVVGFVGKMRETAKNRKIVQDKVAELQKGKEKLSAEINKLKTPAGIEESIRDKFGLAKEGEGMIVVVEEKNPPEVQANAESSGFFYFLRNFFR